MGTFAACACRVCSRPGQGARSSTLDALLVLGIGLGTEDVFGSKPYILYWVEGKLLYVVDSKYLRCGFMLFLSFTYLRCKVRSGNNNDYFVPEVSSAEEAK